jgi:hypothetical protein
VDVSKIDTSTTFLGQKLRIPVMMAPIGSLQTITPRGRRRGRKSRGGVRHDEFCQLGNPAQSGGNRRKHESSKDIPALHSRRPGLV